MDTQTDSAVLDEKKIHKENLERESVISVKFSEENAVISDENNTVEEKNNLTICDTSEENVIHQKDIGGGNQNNINLVKPHFTNVNDSLMKSINVNKKKFQTSGSISEKTKSRQEKIKNEKLSKIKPNDSKSGRKVVPSHNNLIKENNNPKKKIFSSKRNKVNFQMKCKKPGEIKNCSINDDCKEANCSDKQLSTPNAVTSEETANILLENPTVITSVDTQSKNLLDYGFKHLKEEMKALIQQCVEKEDIIESLEKRLKETETNFSETKKKCLHLEQRSEKLLKNLEEITDKQDKTEQDLNAAIAYIAEAKQAKKIADNTIADLEKRLRQTLAQKEKLRSKLDVTNLGGKNAQISSQQQIEQLTESNKLLSRQKSELREVVIKQMQLVSNLKRQLLHLKVGMAQDYTEQEVLKVVEEFY